MHCYLNDHFTEEEKAALPVSDLSIQRGYGIFDFFRVANNKLLFVEDHVDRFLRSAEIMRLPPPYSKQALLGILNELVGRNNIPNAGIRMILTGGCSPDAYTPGKPNFIVMQSGLNIPDLRVPKAVSIVTHEFVRDIPEAKTINYMMGIWLQAKLREQQADDVLYHRDGVVTEFPRCNFFLVTKDGRIVTPRENALKGITRKRILMGSHGFPVSEGPVTIQDIQLAGEAFLTSTTKRIQSIVKMDGRFIGNGQPGPVATELLRLLMEGER